MHCQTGALEKNISTSAYNASVNKSLDSYNVPDPILNKSPIYLKIICKNNT